MNDRVSSSYVLQTVGVVLAGTGTALLLGVFLATDPAEALVVVAMSLLLLAAGVGLLRRRVWGWYLGVFVTVSGALVVSVGLLTGGRAEWPLLLAPLVTDVLLLLALLWDRPHRQASHSGTSG
jgi:hypothetical protein